MRNSHGSIEVLMDAFHTGRILQRLLEDLFETENHVGLCLLAEVNMGPLAHT